MCMFSSSVEKVSNTNIFARGNGNTQFLAYSMSYKAAMDLAMILPLPTPPNSPEDAVRFISLADYPQFFSSLSSLFPSDYEISCLMSSDLPEPPLQIHDVGSFEASFVPHIKDFDRLDKRFIIPREVWGQLPHYADYGFAVFKLKSAETMLNVHPMAFEFPRRDPGKVFFPTVHIHDEKVHSEAEFDHALYCQSNKNLAYGWEAGDFVKNLLDNAKGIIHHQQPFWRVTLNGIYQNIDVWVPDKELPL